MIDLNIYELDNERAEHLGNCLFLINSGAFTLTINDLLKSIAKDETINKKLIQKVIKVWVDNILEVTNQELLEDESPIESWEVFNNNKGREN